MNTICYRDKTGYFHVTEINEEDLGIIQEISERGEIYRTTAPNSGSYPIYDDKIVINFLADVDVIDGGKIRNATNIERNRIMGYINSLMSKECLIQKRV